MAYHKRSTLSSTSYLCRYMPVFDAAPPHSCSETHAFLQCQLLFLPLQCTSLCNPSLQHLSHTSLRCPSSSITPSFCHTSLVMFINIFHFCCLFVYFILLCFLLRALIGLCTVMELGLCSFSLFCLQHQSFELKVYCAFHSTQVYVLLDPVLQYQYFQHSLISF